MLQEEKNVTKIPPWTGKKKRTNESAIVERATPDYTPIHSVRTNAKVLYYEFKLYGGGVKLLAAVFNGNCLVSGRMEAISNPS